MFSAPGIPPERPVEVRIPELALPLTFLMELFKFPLPCRLACFRIMFEMLSAAMDPEFYCLETPWPASYCDDVRSLDTCC